MIGALAAICYAVSMLTYKLKIGLVAIQQLIVTVIVVPDGIVVLKPETWMV